MITVASKLLVRMGLAMLILSLLLRLAIRSPSGTVGDDLAIIACLLMVITGLIGARVGKRVDKPLTDLQESRRREREAKLRR